MSDLQTLNDINAMRRQIDQARAEFDSRLRLLQRERGFLIASIDSVKHGSSESSQHLPRLTSELQAVEAEISDTRARKARTMAELEARAGKIEGATLPKITANLLKGKR